MDNITYVLYICFLIPMLLSLLIMEKKSRLVVGFVLLGTTVCLFVGELNTYLYNVIGKDMVYYTTTIAPITEELVKAAPILVYAVAFPVDRQKLVQGAFAVGLGFAIMENVTMLAQDIGLRAADATVSWALVRGLGAGLMHSICTAVVGIGISFVKKKKKLFYTGTLSLLMLAVTYHSIYNTLATSDYQYLGILLPITTYVPLLFFYRKRQSAFKDCFFSVFVL